MEKTFSITVKDVPTVQSRFRRIVTPLPAPASLPILEEIRRCEPRSTQGQAPVVWDRADGFQVYDANGNMWLDWSAGVLVANIGHGHPKVRKAIQEEIERGLLFAYCFPTEARARLAAKLVALAPPGLDKVFLLNTGSEATENAIKVAKAFALRKGESRRTIIISFERGFHGRTLGAQLAGGSPAGKDWIGCACPNFVQVPFPDGFRTPETGFDTFTASLARQGVDAARVAGVLMESYQGGGASFAPADYVKSLRAWCSANGVLLMMDEVQSGFGRTGKLFAYEHYGVMPDLVCCGKGISSSLPVAAVLGRSEYMDLFDPGSMTSTHGGHSVCCAAALANLEVLEEEGIVEHAARVGAVLRDGLLALQASRPERIGAVHGKGLVYGLHMIRNGREPDPETAFEVVRRCFEAGLLLFAPVGFGGATVKICPPLTITEAAIRDGLEVLAGALRSASDASGGQAISSDCRRPQEQT